MKLKKVRNWASVGIVALVVLVVLAIVWIDRIAEAGIETGSTTALGTETTLDGVDIGILSGRSDLSGLNIANPAGFKTDHFLHLDQGALAVSLGSLRTDTVEIPEISLSGVDVNLEKKGLKSNYQVIMDNLGRFESKEEAKPQEREGKKFIIRQIVIENVNVHIDLLPIGGEATRVTLPIAEIRLQNVGTGSDQGIVVAQLIAVLMKAILMSAIEKGGDIIPGDVLADLGSAMENLKSLQDVGATLAVDAQKAVQELTKQGAEAAAKISETTKETANEIKKGIGELLEKKPEEDK